MYTQNYNLLSSIANYLDYVWDYCTLSGDFLKAKKKEKKKTKSYILLRENSAVLGYNQNRRSLVFKIENRIDG